MELKEHLITGWIEHWQYLDYSFQDFEENIWDTAFYKKVYKIIEAQNNTEKDLDYFSELTFESFKIFISHYATELLKVHIARPNEKVDHAFPWVKECIVWSCVQAWVIEKWVNLSQIDYDIDDSQQKMISRYAISLEDLQPFLVAKKRQDTQNFQSAIKKIQERCCEICDEH